MRKIATLFLFLLLPAVLFAAPADSLSDESVTDEAAIAYLDSIDKKIPYQHGKVQLRDFASLNVPAGYKFIPQTEAQWLVEKIWGNPARPDIMGLLVRENYNISASGTWAFVLSWDESGFVKDDDAKDLDYEEMLKNIQEAEPEENKERAGAGYPAIHTLRWAAKPFYDGDNKVLHWAKELEFGGSPEHVLNYDVRILGRKGVLSMNAVGDLSQLDEIRTAIPTVIHAPTFSDGHRYADFNPKMDKVAAYTVGGLIAGKLLAKAGLFALILKNIKLIGIGLVAGFAALRKRLGGLFGRRRREDEVADEMQPAALPAASNPQEGPNSGHEPLP